MTINQPIPAEPGDTYLPLHMSLVTNTSDRDTALYMFLTTPDEEGYFRSYAEAGVVFNLSRQRVSILFRREWENRADGMEEPVVRDGRPRMSFERFIDKYQNVIIALQSGMSVPDAARHTTYRRGTVRWVAIRCEELGLLCSGTRRTKDKVRRSRRPYT